MEHIIDTTLLTCFLFFIFMFIKLYVLPKPTKTKYSNLPPGPPELPIIGSLHYLILNRRQPLHRTLRDLAEQYGPLIHLRLGQSRFVIGTSSDAALEIMKTQDVSFASRPSTFITEILSYGHRDIVFSPYGENWRQLRKLAVIELFSIKRVQSFELIREKEILNLMKYLESMQKSPVNLSEKLTSLMNDITAVAAFGDKCKDQKLYLSAMDEVTKLSNSGFSLVDLFPESKMVKLVSRVGSTMKRCFARVDGVLDGMLMERKRSREAATAGGRDGEVVVENLLDVILRHQENGEFSPSNEQVKAVIFDVFQAGTGTSSTAMAWAMAELIKNPRVMNKAQAEIRNALANKPKLTEGDIHNINYLKLVVKETLRLHPSAPLLLPRVSTKDCTLLGYEIPANTKILVNAWAMGRDSRYWEDPEEFRPERFEGSTVDFKGNNFEFIPFGAGRRICPGMHFAQAAMEATLARLLCYFDWSTPAGTSMQPHGLDMSESSTGGARRKFDLLLSVKPCIPLPGL